MKRTIRHFLTVAIAVLGISGMVYADTNAPALTPSQAAQQLITALESGQTNWIGVAVLEWAKSLPKDQFGGSAGLYYKVNDYLLTGARVEYIDGKSEFFSGSATLQLPVHPLPGLWPSLTTTPFVETDAGIPFGKKSVSVAGAVSTGLQCTLWQSPHKYFGAGLLGGIEKRTDVTGEIYFIGPNLCVNW